MWPGGGGDRAIGVAAQLDDCGHGERSATTQWERPSRGMRSGGVASKAKPRELTSMAKTVEGASSP